jgi:hypothetical protein
VASDVSFSALDLQAFDDPAFDTAFRTDFALTVAASAGVEPYRVQITAVSAGSVMVSFTVRFPLAAAASKETFVTTLATSTSSVFEASTSLQSYGSVRAIVLAPPPPPSPPLCRRACNTTVETCFGDGQFGGAAVECLRGPHLGGQHFPHFLPWPVGGAAHT